RLEKLIQETTENLEKFHFSEAGLKIYDFLWGDLCDWYLEITKGEHKNPVVLYHVLKNTLKLLHPFVPFITEAIWENLGEKETLITSTWPKYDKSLVYPKEAKEMELIHEVISSIRRMREKYSVPIKKQIHAVIYAGSTAKALKAKSEPIMRLSSVAKLDIKAKGPKIKKSVSAFLKGIEIYLPLEDLVDADKEKKRIQNEIDYKQGFVKQVQIKLHNKNFVDRAPKQVVEKEKRKLSEAEDMIKKLQKQLRELN
ncbi:class I tRNA ligase family protein, partial [Patescibacteria group bacterium]|nr:class I tRNA ligase family protein [Patescibacteria group bacterium]